MPCAVHWCSDVFVLYFILLYSDLFARAPFGPGADDAVRRAGRAARGLARQRRARAARLALRVRQPVAVCVYAPGTNTNLIKAYPPSILRDHRHSGPHPFLNSNANSHVKKRSAVRSRPQRSPSDHSARPWRCNHVTRAMLKRFKEAIINVVRDVDKRNNHISYW